MGTKKIRKHLRAAPRLKLDEEILSRLRFTTSSHKKILTSHIYDISETGLSFVCTERMAPRINEIIMLEFVPGGTFQIACMGRVVRTELPTPGANWNTFPGIVKVGLSYHHLPRQYKRIISESISTGLSKKHLRKSGEVYEISSYSAHNSSWFSQNWQSVLATAALVLGAIAAAFLIWNGSKDRAPASNSEWARGFFEKIKNEK